MEETKEPTEVEEKKQVKFSDNSKETTYEKDQDVVDTTDDEEGTKTTENTNIVDEKSKIGAEEILSLNVETDEEKLVRLGEKYEINTDKPNNGVDQKENSSEKDEEISYKEEAKKDTIPDEIEKEDETNNDKDTVEGKENNDNEKKKEIQSFQPSSMSYSLNSRGQQTQNHSTDDSNNKSNLQVPLDGDTTTTPRDVELTEGQESERNVERDKAFGEKPITNETDESKAENTDKQYVQDISAEHSDEDKPAIIKEIYKETDQEKIADEKSEKSSNDLKEGEDKPNVNAVEVQPTPVKQNVKLDLSNNTNDARASQRSNGRNSAHIKTDFRNRRPVQTTATKISVPTNKSGEKAATNRSAKTNRSLSPKEIAVQERAERQRKAQSARPSGRMPQTARSVTSGTSSRSSRPPSRPRSCGYESERRRMKEFFQAELRRLKQSLGNEAKKFKRPKVRDHYPDVYTSLVPYCNTYEANFLINMPVYGYREKQSSDLSKSTEKREGEEHEDDELMFTTRSTAIRLCDPWDSLNMDRNVLPKLETAELRQRRMDQMRATPKPKSPRAKRPEAKQGSTRLPKFPVITTPNQDLTKKELCYGDVPMLRDELVKNYSHNGQERKKTDYKRTKQDFFRMELDRVNDYHKLSRPHMRAAYYAYLQNTPGSRKALMDCMKEIQQKKGEQTPQAVA